MKIAFITIISLFISINSYAFPILLGSAEGLNHPESVLIHNGSIYVSDMGKDTDSEVLYDGSLRKYDFLGNEDKAFNTNVKLMSPMGMVVIGNTIYLADTNRIVGVSLITGELAGEYDFVPFGATFLNDITKLDSNTLLVTATSLKKIYIINIANNSINEFDINLFGTAPNGILFEKKTRTLFLASNKHHTLGDYGNGMIMKYHIDKNYVVKEVDQFSIGKFIDGISIRGNELIVSDWFARNGKEGKLYHIDKNKLEFKSGYNLNHDGLADIDYNKGILAVPDLINGQVFIYSY